MSLSSKEANQFCHTLTSPKMIQMGSFQDEFLRESSCLARTLLSVNGFKEPNKLS